MSFLNMRQLFSRKIRVYAAAATVIFAVSAEIAQPTSAYQATNGNWSWAIQGSSLTINGATWYTGAKRTTTLQSGITVSVAVAGNVAISSTDQTLATRGGLDSQYSATGIASSTGAQLIVNDTGCTY